MPELPDVERFKSYLDATSLHQAIESVDINDSKTLENVTPRKLRKELQGQAFESTSRHGKFLFVRREAPPLLVLHFGMTGYLDYALNEREPPPHSRTVFHFATGYRLAYVCQRKLGLITLCNDQRAFVEQRGLGPDALDEELTRQVFVERVSGRRGAVKTTLMNQAIVAGIGNVYADEILFQAGIAPSRRIDSLDEKTLRKLYHTMRRVLKTVIRNNADVSQLPRTYLLPQREEDGQCPRCGRELRKTTVSGRGTYFCAHCQE